MANVDGNIPLLIGANVELDKSSMSGVSSKMAKYAKEISNQFDAIVNYTQRRGKDITFDFLTESLNKAVASCGASMKQLSTIIADGTAKGLDPSKILFYHQQLAVVTEDFRKLSAMKQIGLTEETFGDPKRLELVAHAFEQIDKSMQSTYAQVAEMEQAFASLQTRMEQTSSSNPLDNITNSFLDSFTDPKSTGLGTLEEQAQRIKDVLFDLNATAFEGRTGARQYVQEIEDMYGGVVREMYGAESAKSIFQRLTDDASRLTQSMWTARQELTETTNQMGQKIGAITPESISKVANFVEPFSNALQTFQHNIDALMTKVDSYTAKQKEAERLEAERLQAAKQAQIAQQEAEAQANAEADAIIALAQRQEEAEQRKAEAARRTTEEYHAQREASGEAANEMAVSLGGAMDEGTSDKIKSLSTYMDNLHISFNRAHPAISKVASALRKIGSIGASAFNTVRSGASKLIGHFKNLKKSADHSLDGFGKKAKRITLQMVKAMIGVRGLYMLFRKIKSAFTESFKSMAEAVPEVNAVMTDFKSALNNVKMSLATAFQPILQVVLPVLTAFLNVISRLLVALGNFFAILTGQGYIYEWTAAQEGYADAIGNTGKAAKKAQRDLMGFDEINRLSDNDSGSGGGGGGSGGGGSGGGYKQVPVTDPDGAIADFIQKIKDAWKNADFTDVGSWLGEKIKGGLSSLETWLKNNGDLATKAGTSVATFLNGLFSVEGLGAQFGSTLAAGFNWALTGAHSFVHNLKFDQIGTQIGQALDTLFNHGIDWDMLAYTFSDAFNGVFSLIGSASAEFDLGDLGGNIAHALNVIFTDESHGIDWDNLADTFSGVFNNIFDGVNEFGENFDFSGASRNIFGSINRMLNGTAETGGIDWTTLGELAATYFNGIIDVINGVQYWSLSDTAANIASSFNTALQFADFGAAAQAISGAVLNFVNGGITLIKKTDWKQVGSKIFEFIGNVDWHGIAESASSAVSAIGSGIKDLVQGGIEYVNNQEGGWKTVAESLVGFIQTALSSLPDLILDVSLAIKDAAKGVVELSFATGRVIVDKIEKFAANFSSDTMDDFGQERVDETGSLGNGWQIANDLFTEARIKVYKTFGLDWMISGAIATHDQVDELVGDSQQSMMHMSREADDAGKRFNQSVHATGDIIKDIQGNISGANDKLQATVQSADAVRQAHANANVEAAQSSAINSKLLKSVTDVHAEYDKLGKGLNGLADTAEKTGQSIENSSKQHASGSGKYYNNMLAHYTDSMGQMPTIAGTALSGISTAMSPLATIVGGFATDANTNMETAFDKSDSWAQNKAKGINDKFSAIVGGIKTSATSANTNMETAFSKSDNWAQNRVKGILDKFATMPSAINKDATDSNTNMENAFSGSDKWSQDKVKSILDQFATMPNAINTDATDSYNNMTTAFNGTTDWATTTLGLITGQFDLLPTSMQTDAGDAYTNMTTAFDGTFDWVSGVYDDITGAFDPFAEFMDMEGSDANDYFRKHFDDIPTWSSDTLDALKGGFDDGSAEGMKSWFDSVGTDAYSSMTSPFDAIRDFADSKYRALKLGFGFGTADSPVSIFTNEFNNAYSAISTIFGGMGGLAEKEWGNFKGGFSTVSTWFGTTFGDAWQQVQNVFSKGGSIFGGIDNAVTDSMKSMINRIVSGTNNVIASPFEALNNRLYKISQIQILPNIYPFAWLKSISIPQIPKLAQGGVIPPNREFLAVLGDQSRGTNVEAPLSTIQEAVAQVMSSNNAELMRGFMMVVEAINNKNLVIGDKEIGKANSRYTSRENIRRGYAT